MWGTQCAHSTSWTESCRSSDGSRPRDRYSKYTGWKRLRNGRKTLWKTGTNPPDCDSRNTADAVQIDVVNYESGDSQTRKRSRKQSTDKTTWPAGFMTAVAPWAAVAGRESGSAQRTPQTGHTRMATIKRCGHHETQKGWKKKKEKTAQKKKRKLSQKTRAREDPEHTRIVRHKIRWRDVEHRLTFALADARSVREVRGIQRTGNLRIFSIIDPNPRRLEMELAGTSNPQRPNCGNDDATSPNLTESACKCMHSRPRLFVTQTGEVSILIDIGKYW